MSLGGGGPLDGGDWQMQLDELAAQTGAARATRLAGHTPLLRRLRERLRPHREEPGSDLQSTYGACDNPGYWVAVAESKSRSAWRLSGRSRGVEVTVRTRERSAEARAYAFDPRCIRALTRTSLRLILVVPSN